MSTGYRVTGTVTFEVPVDVFTTALDNEQAFHVFMTDLIMNCDTWTRLTDSYIHDDLNFEPYDLDGPDWD